MALSHGVALVTGPQFAIAPGEAWVDHVRLPFTTATDDLQEGMRRMARAWAEFLPRAEWAAAQQRAVV